MKRLAIIIALAAALGGCAYDIKPSEQSVLHVDVYVKRNNPTVYVQPVNAPARPFKAVVLPFAIQQDVDNSRHISKQLTEVFANTWSQDQVFPTIFYEPTQEGLTKEQAILVARDRRVDCVVMGRYTYILAGGTRSDSAVSLSLEIFDANTGQRIWQISQAGRMDPDRSSDFMFFRKENRMPQDPLWSIVTTLAHDTGGTIKKWNQGLQYHSSGALSEPVSAPKDYPPPPTPKQPVVSTKLDN